MKHLVVAAAAWLAAASAAQALVLESCVSSDALNVAAADRHVFIEDADLADVASAIAARFPLLQRDGFEPSRLLLWERPGSGWLYVAVIENPQKRGEMCFTATVTAATVGITREVLKKYFPERSA
jgi:hypothetical protein